MFKLSWEMRWAERNKTEASLPSDNLLDVMNFGTSKSNTQTPCPHFFKELKQLSECKNHRLRDILVM